MLQLQLADLAPICPLHVTGSAGQRTELQLPTMALLVVLDKLKLPSGAEATLSFVIRTFYACLLPILEVSAPTLTCDSKLLNTSTSEGMKNVKGYTKLKAAAATRLVSIVYSETGYGQFGYRQIGYWQAVYWHLPVNAEPDLIDS